MPTSRHFVVEVPPSERGEGSSGTSTLQASYPSSPIYSGEINDDTIQEQFEDLVIEGEVADGFMFEDGFNRDYVDAPDHGDISTDNEGRPLSSPFAPSLASPPGGVDDFANQPATPEATQQAGEQSAGPFPSKGSSNPKDSSVTIARQTIGSLRRGNSTPGS